ncbi:hypothetical protein C943_01705 [Mariniradius saccharolyticus AK6]|uniref:Uncharacterized protein n=1 Tax=Mariniradius saccharolyticus AK6 TaxID=1239962 RepID=M7X3C0_9BACT|nr:hypothetical protein C943_01705 [Mariniradius saccharolyticus AK6]
MKGKQTKKPPFKSVAFSLVSYFRIEQDFLCVIPEGSFFPQFFYGVG